MTNVADPQAFKLMQRQGWDSAAEGWKNWWKTIEDGAQVVSDKLVELAQIRPGSKILDIATGIGEPTVTAARKARPGGKVMAIDISPQMLAIAKERAKENGLEDVIEFREADAEAFSLPSSGFDAIISRFGLMFLPDLPNTLKTLREALVPGGRIAAAVWSAPQNVPGLSMAFGTVMKEVGVSPPAPGTPGPFSLADKNALQEKFQQAGYQDIKIETGKTSLRLASPKDYTALNRAIAAPLKAMMAKESPARQEEIWNAVTDAARKHVDPATGSLHLISEVIYVSAQK